MKRREFGLAFNKGKLFFRKIKRAYNFWKICFRARNDSTHEVLNKFGMSETSCWIGLFSKFVKFHLVKNGNRQEITRKNNVVQGGKLSLIKPSKKRHRVNRTHAQTSRALALTKGYRSKRDLLKPNCRVSLSKPRGTTVSLDRRVQTHAHTTLGGVTWYKPRLRSFKFRCSLHKLTDELNSSRAFLQAANACFFFEACSRALTCREKTVQVS